MLLQGARWTDLLSLVLLQVQLIGLTPYPANLFLAVSVALIVYLVGEGQLQASKTHSALQVLAAAQRQLKRDDQMRAEEDAEWRERVRQFAPSRPSRSPSPQPPPTCSTTNPKRRTTRQSCPTPAPRTPLPR